MEMKAEKIHYLMVIQQIKKQKRRIKNIRFKDFYIPMHQNISRCFVVFNEGDALLEMIEQIVLHSIANYKN